MAVLIQHSRPSWKQGFARSKGESAFPGLWSGLGGAWVPSLGVTGDTLFDVSGHKSHGSLTNMEPATDWVLSDQSGSRREVAYALDFDGSDDYVSVPDNDVLDLTSQGGAISVWFRGTGQDEPYAALVDKGDSDTHASHNYILSVTSNVPTNERFRLTLAGDGSTIVNLTGPSNSFLNNKWYHVVGQWDASNLWIYQDGIQIASEPNSVTMVSNADPLSIGRFARTAPGEFRGQIDNILIYNRPLSLSEIQQLFVDPVALFRRRRVLGLVSVGEEVLGLSVGEILAMQRDYNYPLITM